MRQNCALSRSTKISANAGASGGTLQGRPCTIASRLFLVYGAIFFTVFCVLPDLVFSVMMAIHSVVNAFDMAQYEAPEEMQHREPLQMEEQK